MAREKEQVADAEAEAAEKESKKAPKPDGFVSPIDYAKHRSELLGKEIRPQTIYSYVRNSEDFPAEKNTDGRYMVNQEAADRWFEERAAAKAARKAEKEAKKAAEADKEAAAAE